MSLQIEERIGYTFVQMQENRLDLFSSSVLKENLLSLVQDKGVKNILLDISNCSFCDASGLGTIMAIHNLCEDAGGKLFLIPVQENVAELIKICMLNKEWNIANDVSVVETHFKRSA